jgi:hypothetical protein
MLKRMVILKRVLILAMLSACLVWISFAPVPTAAAYICCRDCNAQTEACGESCNDDQACIDRCLQGEVVCFSTCTNSTILCP